MVGGGRRKRIVVRVAVVVIRVKQASEISRDVAVAAAEDADRHVLFELDSGFRQHPLRYVGVQRRPRDAFLQRTNHLVIQRTRIDRSN